MSATIILVSPQLPENIGMIARVMLNFNIKNLVIVNPKNPNFLEKASTTSCGAFDIINYKVVSSLEDALEDAHIVFAFTSRKRALNKPCYQLKEAFTKYQHYFDTNINIAFLFGSERIGLTNKEVSMANFIITFETNQDFPVLNIAQSVSLLAYEYNNYYKEKNIIDKSYDNNFSNQKEINYFLNDLISKLEEKNYFHKKTNKHIIREKLQTFLLRATPSKEEINSLIAITKLLSKKNQ